jgi:hypothetical protein
MGLTSSENVCTIKILKTSKRPFYWMPSILFIKSKCMYAVHVTGIHPPKV